ncbi:MAG: type II 3-dehydroquinate dehydratase [Endozoicomonadaceae bacterium]|nr:type II 3-dehydroquinate dehydratase [Endozoicomonadaceae bacterium]
MAKLLVLNGPNLNLLGNRETDLYGSSTLNEIIASMEKQAHDMQHELQHIQDNAEVGLIDAIHQAKHNNVQIIIFNPAAFTHTSIALRDALLAVAIPFIEVHLSNIDQRESFRKNSFFSDIAMGVISGFGPQSYQLAMQAAIAHLFQQ